MSGDIGVREVYRRRTTITIHNARSTKTGPVTYNIYSGCATSI